MRVKNPLSHNGEVQLWTRQHIDSLKDLESTGVFNIKYHFIYLKLTVILLIIIPNYINGLLKKLIREFRNQIILIILYGVLLVKKVPCL